ncbi:MAG TPA: patatin-like phospholipase family protein [Blastocatellia bacterium]|nr:patatin-like phospholipase family protein [Blastocatellia bacterium]
MANTETKTPRLLLSQVLEEEYVKLHNGTPPVYPAGAGEDERLKEIFKLIHKLPRKRGAFCISGGGIRSATFALGIIQGLARCGVLDKFDYLSTVSGGGYIGSWLTAWIHRHGMSHVLEALADEPKSPITPEPGPVSRLRDYSSYLDPKLGLLSADTWSLVATVLRNLMLNWFVLVPLLAAALMIPRVGIPVLQITFSTAMAKECLVAGCILLVWALGYIGFHRPSIKLLSDNQGGFLKWCLLPLLTSSILLITYWGWEGHKLEWPNSFAFDIAGKTISLREDLLIFVGLGIVINFVAFLGGTLVRFREIRLTVLWEALVIIVTGALGGCVTWCIATVVFPDPLKNDTTLLLYVCFSSPAFLMSLLVTDSVFVGLSSYWTSDHDREWWARAGAWILIYVVGWSAASALLIFGPMGLLYLGTELRTIVASVGSLSGVITILAGRSGKTASQEETERKKRSSPSSGLTTLITQYGLALAAPAFAIFLTVAIALGAEILFHRSVPHTWEDYRLALLLTTFKNLSLFVIGLAAVGYLMGIFININKFSLHAMYRNRLIRAYLGASREHRKPNLFTGFDEDDNIQMHKLWPNQKPAHEDPPRQPFHVINMALNLVAGEKLAWQQRKAESFTVSALHAGNYCENVGYRRTEYDVDGKKIYYGGQEGISLGTAVAISGAAASPNMGYHSSPIIGFLMTLFNARMGWWLGNTAPAGLQTFQRSGPLHAARPMIEEALGLTNDENQYVYLSDGGHFENLALYEMVLRRCHTIVVSDAGQDGDFKFEDLGGAVRKIRIDFGIPVTFDQGIKIYSRLQRTKGYYCAIGTIGYSCVDGQGTDGLLIYIKPTFYGTEPADVYQYAQTDEAFPHDSTADQWFNESQFESYRMLGSYIIGLICGGDEVHPGHKQGETKNAARDTGLDDFVNKVREYLERPVEQQLDERYKSGS